MRRSTPFLSLITLTISLSLTAAPARVHTTKTHKLEEVAEGVYFATGPGAMFLMSNAMVVVTDEDVVVVDSHITPAASRALIESIRTITEKPITTLINTHFHYDHAHGAQSFRDVQIIGHEYTREKLIAAPLEEHSFLNLQAAFERGLVDLKRRLDETTDETERGSLEAQIAFNQAHIKATEEVQPVAPDVTMSDRLTLFRGGREIQVHFFGRAHTAGDVAIYLPKERIVFTGDMLLGGISWLGDGYVSEWSATLENLKSLDFERILPGHGPIFYDRARIDYVQAYYEDLNKEVVRLRKAGLTAEETAAQADLTRHSDTLGVKDRGASLDAVKRIYQLLDQNND